MLCSVVRPVCLALRPLPASRLVRPRRSVQCLRAKGFGASDGVERALSTSAGVAAQPTPKLDVVRWPSPSLRAPNKDVKAYDASLRKLCKAMFDAMYESEGVGLAAPQVGVNVNLMVYNSAGRQGEGTEYVLCNPKIVSSSDELDWFEEGCLSFPDVYAMVERPFACSIKARDVKGKRFTLDLDALDARVFQHEYDHLEQRLFTDLLVDEERDAVDADLRALVAEYRATHGAEAADAAQKSETEAGVLYDELRARGKGARGNVGTVPAEARRRFQGD